MFAWSWRFVAIPLVGKSRFLLPQRLSGHACSFSTFSSMASFLLGHSLVRTRVNELLMVAVATFSSAYLNTVKRKMKSTRLEAVWRQACNREFLIKILPYSKPKWGIKTWVVLSRQVIVQRFKSPLFVLR